MRFHAPDRWVVLKLVYHERVLHVEYEDDRGTVRRVDQAEFVATDPAVPIRWPADIDALLAESLRSSRDRLPLFVENLGSALDYALIASLPSLANRGAWELVRKPVGVAHDFAPFDLPLSITGVGSAAPMLDKFGGQWFTAESIRLGTLRIEHLESHQIGDPWNPAGQVVVANETDALTLLLLPAMWNDPPRLLIAVEHNPASTLERIVRAQISDSTIRWPSSVLWLPAAYATPENVEEALMAIVHDLPLHHALPRVVPEEENPPVLLSTPAGIQALRMSDAFAAAARDDLTSQLAAYPGVEFDIHPHMGEGETGTPLDLEYNFVRESKGLVPLGRARSMMPRPLTRSERLQGHYRGIVTRDDVVDQPEPRRVDARIERVDYVPDVDAYGKASRSIWVPADRTLRRGGRYRLRVQIGRDFEGNLVSADVPPIDALLPPSLSFYDLEVVLFAKDFKALSGTLLPLRLPTTGASEPVYFDIEAPPGLAAAQLRFGLYFRNQLVQSFALDAQLEEEEVERPDGLKVTLDFTKSASFTNLDELTPRAMSLGLNDNAAAGAHAILLKIDEVSDEIPLTELKIEKPLKRFHDALDAAAAKDKAPVFPAEGEAVTPAQRAAFGRAVRELARIGSDLFLRIFDGVSDAMREKLRSLARAPNKPLQFHRHSHSFTVPWAILYDFFPPNDDKAPVCDGTDGGKPCGHKAGDPVFCVNGFWGIRHAIEEHLAGSAKAQNAARVVERSKTAKTFVVAYAPGDTFGKSLVEELGKEIAPDEVTFMDPVHLLDDVLWDAQKRPPILMVVGHLDEAGGQRRIQVPGTAKWLTSGDITRVAYLRGDWKEQPSSIVLLMACDALRADPTTLHDHALALTRAGAAAVLGPECKIFPRFACRVAKEIVLAMLDKGTKQSLGNALSAFRRRLIRSGNPLAFAFTAFGDADVVIA